MSTSRRLSLAAFTAWLATKHERTKIGLSCESDSCPLAKFLTQTTGVPYEVDGDVYTPAKLDSNGKVMKDSYGLVIYDESQATELPQWARHFVEQVDAGDGSSVSTMRALRIAESTTLGRAARMG
jgi:hypothetical protein